MKILAAIACIAVIAYVVADFARRQDEADRELRDRARSIVTEELRRLN